MSDIFGKIFGGKDKHQSGGAKDKDKDKSGGGDKGGGDKKAAEAAGATSNALSTKSTEFCK